MEQDFKREIFDFIRTLCSGAGISVEFGDSGKLTGDVHINNLNLSFKIHSLKDAHLARYVGHELFSWQDRAAHLVVQLWEDQWIQQKSKVKSKIRSLLGLTKRLHARETKVVTIDNSSLVSFLEKHHMNVAIKGKYKYGLVYGKELVAVISFSKGRPMLRDNEAYESYELLRFCNKLNYTVVGGFTKLMQHFIKARNPDDIMTYIDADWSTGKSLLSMGFEYVETKEPMEFWLDQKTGLREYPHLVLQQHHKLKERKPDDLDAFLKKHGYTRIYNSGSYKFLLKLK